MLTIWLLMLGVGCPSSLVALRNKGPAAATRLGTCRKLSTTVLCVVRMPNGMENITDYSTPYPGCWVASCTVVLLVFGVMKGA